MTVKRAKREEQTYYEGRSGLTQSQPFISLARLAHFRMWTEEEEKEWGKRNDHAKLVEARAEVQGRSDPLPWDSVSIS